MPLTVYDSLVVPCPVEVKVRTLPDRVAWKPVGVWLDAGVKVTVSLLGRPRSLLRSMLSVASFSFAKKISTGQTIIALSMVKVVEAAPVYSPFPVTVMLAVPASMLLVYATV